MIEGRFEVRGDRMSVGALVALALLVSWMVSLVAVEAEAGEEAATAGKAVFLQLECAECHAVSRDGIEVIESEDDEGDDFDDFDEFAEEEEPAPEPPDLSDVQTKRSAQWVRDFIQKKSRSESGRRHPEKFKGTDEQLNVVVLYLAGSKAD